MNQTRTAPNQALSIREFSRWSGIGRTAIYEQINQGRLRPKKSGRRTLISAEEALRWWNSLPDYHREGHAAPFRSGQDLSPGSPRR